MHQPMHQPMPRPTAPISPERADDSGGFLAAKLRIFALAMGAAAALALGGCATPPVAPSLPAADPGATDALWQQRRAVLSRLSAWRLRGKIAVKTGRRGGSATLLWDYRQSGPGSIQKITQQIELYGPFGGGRVRISAQPEGATLKDTRGGVIQAATAAEALHQKLGWQVPFAELRHWARGLPNPGAVDLVFDGAGRLLSFSQGDWLVRYDDYAAVAAAIPADISAISADIPAIPAVFDISDISDISDIPGIPDISGIPADISVDTPAVSADISAVSALSADISDISAVSADISDISAGVSASAAADATTTTARSLILPRKMTITAAPGRIEVYARDGTYIGDQLSVKIIFKRWRGIEFSPPDG